MRAFGVRLAAAVAASRLCEVGLFPKMLDELGSEWDLVLSGHYDANAEVELDVKMADG